MVYNGQQTTNRIPTKKILLWLAMVSMIMLFAGLTSAYLVRQAEGNWLHFELPPVFALSTAVLLISSLTLNFANTAAKKGNMKSLSQMLLLTLGLGLLFVGLQFSGWGYLVKNEIFFAGKDANPSGSFLYVLTGLHVAHLVAGILWLAYVIFDSKRSRKNYGMKNLLRLQVCSTFWHFLDGLWVYLFLFLYFAK